MKIVATLLSLLAVAAGAEAQTCAGRPLQAASVYISGGAVSSGGSRGFGIGAGGSHGSRTLWEASFGLTDLVNYDETANDVVASLGYVLVSGHPFTVCPGIAGGYSWWSGSEVGYTEDASTLHASIGVGLGADVPLAAGARAGLFARPALIYQRTSVRVAGDDLEFRNEAAEKPFGATAGIGLGFRRTYVTVFGSGSTIDDSDPRFGVLIGFGIR
jgi:hypothetical protein